MSKAIISVVRPLALLAVVAFLLHFAWEKFHIGLYTGYEALEGALPVYLYATIGDVMYTLIAFGIVALFVGQRALSPTAVDYAFFASLGLCIAIFVELKAQMLGRWEYTDAMPTIYGFGVSPLAQMTVLLPLSVLIVVRLERWLNKHI